MKLMNIDEFGKTFYTENSRPINRTIIKRIMEGSIPGKREGNRYMVDVDAYIKLTGNELVDKVILSKTVKKKTEE